MQPDPLRLHSGKDQAGYHRLVRVPADQQVTLAAGHGQHGGVDRQGTAAGRKEGLLRADRVCHQFFGPGQVAVRRRAVIQPGRGQDVGPEGVLAERGASTRIRTPALAVSRRG